MFSSPSSNFHYLPYPFSGFDPNNAFLNNINLHEPITSPNPLDTITRVDEFGNSNLISKKKVVRKDRHSKICTAKGFRDRRVRLSIDIAREFFDLQDMLGFDRASKTLEWLLSKSRKAIEELEESNGTKDVDDEKEIGDGDCVKEIRAKARERARERAKEKIHDKKKKNKVTTNSQMLMSLNHQFNSSNGQFVCDVQFKESSSSLDLPNFHQNWNMISGIQSCGRPWETPTTQ